MFILWKSPPPFIFLFNAASCITSFQDLKEFIYCSVNRFIFATIFFDDNSFNKIHFQVLYFLVLSYCLLLDLDLFSYSQQKQWYFSIVFLLNILTAIRSKKQNKFLFQEILITIIWKFWQPSLSFVQMPDCAQFAYTHISIFKL